MNSKRIFTAPAVLTAVLILGSVSIIIYSQWVIGKTLDRHKALVTLSEIAKRKILLAHLWFEEALAGDQSVNLDQNVYRNIDETLDLISTGLENLQGELKDVTKALMRGDLATAKEKIQGWRKLAEVRWENREDTGETGGELDQEFDAIFRDILVRLQNFSDELNFFIAQDRRKLKWFSVLHVLLLVAICGSTGAIVFRYQRAIKAKNEELEISLKERTFSLARSEKLIRSILSSAVDGIISIDEHGIVELFNPAAERMFGYRADEIIGKTVTLLMPEPYKSEHGEYMRNYLRTGKSNIIGIGIEVVGQRKNGSIFPMELAVSEVRLDDRRLFAGIARDISERKKMEEKIRQFSRAVEQSPASVMITDTHGNIEYANLKFTQVTGYSFEEVEGKNPRFLKSGEQPAEIYKVLWDTISSGKEWRGEFHNKKKNGELFWEVVSVSPIKNQDGETTHFLAVKEDITARKRTQEEIKSLSKFPSENPGPVLRLSSDGKILYANNAGRLLLKHWNREMGQAAPIDWQKNILQVLSSRSSKDVEIDIKDRTFAFQISPIPDMGYVNIYGRDITERKRAEERLKKSREQLVHAEKLSAIGKLAASMAHEFNNPIYGIRNVLEQIEERIPMNDAYKEMAGLAVRECNRVAELIWKLQDFDRPSSGIIAPMDIHEVINDMLILSQKKLKERKITLEKRYADDMPMIRGVADQIRQVVLNLIQNAEEAIPEDGGKITIRTAARDKTIEVHIQNTGRCISPENMKMIFDPFFTTKSSVKGTGLGLSVSYGIVKSHGGDIQVNSKPGRGATFIVSLPRELPNEIALHRKRVDA